MSTRLRVPVWVVASVAAVLLLALFLTWRALLTGGAERVAELTATLHSIRQESISGAAFRHRRRRRLRRAAVA